MAEGVGRVRPKLIDLTGLLDEHGEAIESDLRRFCGGTRLLDLWSGGLTWRELGVLIRGLPPESLTKTALRNAAPVDKLSAAAATAEYGPWSQLEMILAELLDVQRWLQWTKTKDAENNRNPPKPYPRPGVARTAGASGTAQPMSAEVIDMFAYMREHNGAAPPAAYTSLTVTTE